MVNVYALNWTHVYVSLHVCNFEVEWQKSRSLFNHKLHFISIACSLIMVRALNFFFFHKWPSLISSVFIFDRYRPLWGCLWWRIVYYSKCCPRSQHQVYSKQEWFLCTRNYWLNYKSNHRCLYVPPWLLWNHVSK